MSYEDKKIIISCFIFFALITFLLTGCNSNSNSEISSSNLETSETSEMILPVKDESLTAEEKYKEFYKTDDYTDVHQWLQDLQKLKSEWGNKANQDIELWSDYLSEEQKAFLREYENEILRAKTIQDTKKYIEWYNLVVAAAQQNKQNAESSEQNNENTDVVSYTEPYYEETYYDITYTEPTYTEPTYTESTYTNSDGLNPYTGVNYHDGRTETYYSSNVLYHYQTDQWTVDENGFYRTDEGYYVVAASDMPQGTTFEGSMGTCIVLDTGCNPGVTDYYVNW